jgi:cbb3-type cytochrome oxidase subunit 1
MWILGILEGVMWRCAMKVLERLATQIMNITQQAAMRIVGGL